MANGYNGNVSSCSLQDMCVTACHFSLDQINAHQYRWPNGEGTKEQAYLLDELISMQVVKYLYFSSSWRHGKSQVWDCATVEFYSCSNAEGHLMVTLRAGCQICVVLGPWRLIAAKAFFFVHNFNLAKAFMRLGH